MDRIDIEELDDLAIAQVNFVRGSLVWYKQHAGSVDWVTRKQISTKGSKQLAKVA